MRFEWDPGKARRNRAKHGISFEDAVELLGSGAGCLEVLDAEASPDEDRFLVIGIGRRGLLVVVCALRDDEVTRIVSARRATRREARAYNAWWRGSS